jgi:hypothetical protein
VCFCVFTSIPACMHACVPDRVQQRMCMWVCMCGPVHVCMRMCTCVCSFSRTREYVLCSLGVCLARARVRVYECMQDCI